MSKVYLKIKIKSLAEEARIIRKEENRLRWHLVRDTEEQAEYKEAYLLPHHPPEVRRDLYLHRVNDVRTEARAAQIAYAYIRGRRYAQVEENPRWKREQPDRIKPHWHSVLRLINKYGTAPIDHATLKRWYEGPAVDELLAETLNAVVADAVKEVIAA